MSRSVATGLVALAALCSLLSLAGWVFDIPVLRGFGLDGTPIWPLTAIGFLCLSLGFLASIDGRDNLAAALWLVPAALAVLALSQTFLGLDFGVDLLLFGKLISLHEATNPGRPGINSSIIFLILATAGYGARVRNWFSGEAGTAFAVLALGLVGVAGIMTAFTPPGSLATRLFSVSLPSAFATFCLALALFLLHSNLEWVRLLMRRGEDWRSIRILLPTAVILPIVPSLLEQALGQRVPLPPIAIEGLVALANILIVGFVVYWAIIRVARGQATMVELSEALEQSTVVLTNAEGDITHWSRGCEQLYGWTSAEALGRNKYMLLRSQCRLDPGAHGARFEDGQELLEICRDDREISVLETIDQVEIPGRPPVLVLKVTDITQRVAAIEALKVSEERLAVAASAHELGIFEWDVRTGRLEWSPGTEQRLGLVPGTITDFEKWRAQVEPEDVQRILDTVARTVRDRSDKFSYRYRFLQPQGGIRAVEGSSRAFYDAEGNLLRTVGVILDVTEREEREAALRRREAQLRSVLETVPDAMVVIDQNSTILQFSSAAEALWGYRATDVLGRPATMLVPAERRAIHMATLNRFLETGHGIIGEVLSGTAEAADGRKFPIEIRTGVAQSDGQTLLTCFVRNLSEQLATEERLSELSAEIAHVSRQSAMSELAADLAHELNQPLSATSNFLAAARMLIERGEGTDRVVDLLRMGSEQTQRAGEIIRRMRAFMARGEVEMRTESVDRTVRDAVDLVLVGTGQFHIRVNYELDVEAPFIFADRIQVQQVLVNLLRNSMEALRTSGKQERLITISSHKLSEQMIEIAVRDSGPGIPPHVLEHLFSRFTTTKGNGGGMGIGLSISKRIIEAHGGTLSADNRPEGGASFRFTLPAVEEGVE
ncbi:PAS domain S-box protein [Sphingomonas sp. DG1-23]|uniref:PAS domain-containing sensor histidine kinase n=1 Tax=Sphingomonas sp. DG1-23 TaxID=3068316 RepID=UPI00273DA445|nr:PAS domain S-box protein [Sphingomonas sp. DG1-23]MDP5281225.1 PAS domain S-box protein [Sphingomonas sp. DG1-23]